MNRHEFIEELRMRLRRLPQEEIENAVEYYEEYFDDAGAPNESQTITALGSPAAVASKIIGEFAVNDAVKPAPKRMNSLLVVLLAICASPIALPLAAAIVALVIALGSVFFSLMLAGAALTVAGAACAIAGLWTFKFGTATGMFYLGAGIALLAAGLASSLSLTKLGNRVFRGIQRWIGNLLIKNGRRI